MLFVLFVVNVLNFPSRLALQTLILPDRVILATVMAVFALLPGTDLRLA